MTALRATVATNAASEATLGSYLGVRPPDLHERFLHRVFCVMLGPAIGSGDGPHERAVGVERATDSAGIAARDGEEDGLVCSIEMGRGVWLQQRSNSKRGVNQTANQTGKSERVRTKSLCPPTVNV